MMLVHEAYMRLAGQEERGWQGKSLFFAVAAKSIRRVLVDETLARMAN